MIPPIIPDIAPIQWLLNETFDLFSDGTTTIVNIEINRYMSKSFVVIRSHVIRPNNIPEKPIEHFVVGNILWNDTSNTVLTTSKNTINCKNKDGPTSLSNLDKE